MTHIPESSDVALRDLRVLDAIEHDAHLSQRDLSGRIGIALGQTNQVLRRLIRKGLVKTKRINARRVAYYLTPQGFSEKLNLVMRYTEITIGFFAAVREVVNNSLSQLKLEHGVETVAIVGTGELAEAVYLSVQEQGLALLAVYAHSPQAKTWFGVDLLGIDSDVRKVADVVIHTSMRVAEVHALSDERYGVHPMHIHDLLALHLGQFASRIQDGD